MNEKEFEALKSATDLSTMTLEELGEFNTTLSQHREEAGGALRKAIYAYALDVNVWITQRSADREEILEQARGLTAKALLQTVTPGSFKGELEKLLKK